MNARELFEQGRVRDAQQALSASLRDYPADRQQRTFLFELLCFSGDYERARKQLAVLAKDGAGPDPGTILHFSALHAEEDRHELFRTGAFPPSNAPCDLHGTMNGAPFSFISDIDPVVGARLEVYAAGAYTWLPFRHIARITMAAPRRLRDTLWIPAEIVTGPEFGGADFGQVLVPAIYPFSWKADSELVWLGRSTAWAADEDGTEFPVGQKVLRVGDEDVPLLEIRTLEFANAA